MLSSNYKHKAPTDHLIPPITQYFPDAKSDIYKLQAFNKLIGYAPLCLHSFNKTLILMGRQIVIANFALNAPEIASSLMALENVKDDS